MKQDFLEVRRVIHGRIYSRKVPIKGFVAPPEVAALLGVGLRHVYRLLDAGKMPVFRRNYRRLIPCQAVLTYMKEVNT